MDTRRRELSRRNLIVGALSAVSLAIFAYLAASGVWRAVTQTPLKSVVPELPSSPLYSYSLLLMESVALAFIPGLAALLLPRALLVTGWRRVFAFVTVSLAVGAIALGIGLAAAFALGEWGGHPVAGHVALGIASAALMPVLLSPAILYLTRSPSPSRLVVAGLAAVSVVLKTLPIIVAVVVFAIDVARHGRSGERRAI